MKTVIANDYPEYNLPLQDFRSGKVSKSISVTTISFFLWTFFAAPLANAVETENLKQQQKEAQFDAMYERTPEEKLSYRLQKLKDKVTHDIPEKMHQNQSGLFNKTLNAVGLKGLPVDSGMLDEITAIETSISEAELGGLKGFDDDEQQIRNNKKLGKAIKQLALQRHDEARQQVQKHFNQLKQKINNLKQAKKANPQQQAFDDLKQFLEHQQFQKSHSKTDPNHLPFGTPNREERAPLENETALYQLTHDSVMVASNVLTPEILGPKFNQHGGTQADLAETIDTVQTQAIKDLALQLQNDPIQIYTWVANNIKFVPSYGSIQGADMTLQTKRGNAMDTASLLIAILRAAHIPARYAYGTVQMPIDKTMNWVGGVTVPAAAANLMQQGAIPTTLITTQGVITHIKFEHTWVEAFVDFEPSRGTKNIEGDNWIPMDASYKQYDYTQPTVDLKTAVPFDAQGLANTIQQNTTVNEAEGWVQGVPQAQIQQSLTDYQTQLQNYLTTQQPTATVGDVLGLQQVKILPARPLAAGLPYQLITKQSNFSEVADSMRLKFKYELWTESYGEKDQQLFVIEQPTVQLAGKKLALSFKPATQQDADLIASYIPAPDPTTGQIDPTKLPKSLPGYLINLVPEFTLDNTAATSVTQSMPMGTELISTMGYKFPNKSYETTDNNPIAGQYEATALDLQGVSTQQVEKLKTNLESTKAKLEAENINSLTKHDVIGDLLYSTIFSWFALNNLQSEVSSRQIGIVDYRAPSYGLFKTNLETQYSWGVPRNVSADGLQMDVDRSYHTFSDKQNSTDGFRNYMRVTGSRESTMEHLVPEQILSTPESPAYGISSVKAIQLAASDGQRVYTITQNNLNDALNNITLPDEIESEIRNAVYAGKEVTTHQVPINFHGQMAVGYNIIDPELGAGAYKIFGGGNGADIAGDVSNLYSTTATVIETVFTIAATLKKVLLPLAAKAGAVGIILSYIDVMISAIEVGAKCGPEALAAALGFALIFLYGLLLTLAFTGGLVMFVIGSFLSNLTSAGLSFLMKEMADSCDIPG